MKLIVEHIEDIELLTEEKDGKEYTYIQGVFLQATSRIAMEEYIQCLFFSAK